MRRTIILSAISLLLLCACHRATDLLIDDTENGNENQNTSSLIIRSGTSFGMCLGYCIKTLVVDSQHLTFTESSGRGDSAQYPTKSHIETLSSIEWNCLVKAVDSEAFMKLDTVIGCPDCADGGAEWVEITKDGVTRRVTFEYGRTIPTIQPIVDRLRLLREGFNKENNSYIDRTWQWVQSSGGLHGGTQTPTTVGYRQRAIYRGDRSYELYHNDSLVRATMYTITLQNINGTQQEVITYADNNIQQIFHISGDTLNLSDRCIDCFEHLYVKATSICN